MTDLDAIADYFWDRVDTSGEHWMWTGVKDSDGYGQLRLRSQRHRAHRTMWIILEGSVPDGLFVLHRCDVRACVRPTHLFLGSQADNMHDMAAKGRGHNAYASVTHCPQGHAYDEANTYVYRGGRYCKRCAVDRHREARRKARGAA